MTTLDPRSREYRQQLEARQATEVCAACGSGLAVAMAADGSGAYVLRCGACQTADAPTTPSHEESLKQRYRRNLSLDGAGMTLIDSQTLHRQLVAEIRRTESQGKRPDGMTIALLERLEREVNASEGRALVRAEPRQLTVEGFFTGDQIDILRRQLLPAGLTEADLQYALNVAATRRLSPFAGQIHFTVRKVWNEEARQREPKLVIITGIDGHRLNAQRTKQYAGSDDAVYGPMVEDPLVTNGGRRPEWAKVTVWRVVNGVRCPFTATVWWDEKVQGITDGKTKRFTAYTGQWPTSPRNQLAIRAEAFALRKGFPEEMAGFEYGEPDEWQPPTPVAGDYSDVDPQTGEILRAQTNRDAIEGHYEEMPAGSSPFTDDDASTPTDDPAADKLDADLTEFLAQTNATREQADAFFGQHFAGASWEQMDAETRETALYDLQKSYRERQQRRARTAQVQL